LRCVRRVLGDRSEEPSGLGGLYRRWQWAPTMANCCACAYCVDFPRFGMIDRCWKPQLQPGQECMKFASDIAKTRVRLPSRAQLLTALGSRIFWGEGERVIAGRDPDGHPSARASLAAGVPGGDCRRRGKGTGGCTKMLKKVKRIKLGKQTRSTKYMQPVDPFPYQEISPSPRPPPARWRFSIPNPFQPRNYLSATLDV